MDREKLINQYRKLQQYKNLSQEELEKVIDKKLAEDELKIAFVGLKDSEIDRATSLYSRYVSENSFESLAEKSSLINLVYLEILKERVQQFIKKEAEEKNDAIPLAMTEKLLELDNQIISLKEKLGMLRDKDKENALDVINELKEKALNYYKEHGGEIYYKCPHCQELSRQIMQLEGYDIEKATFFKGTTLYNEEVLNLYHQKIITLDQAAKIHGVNPKYITLIYENIFLKERANDSKN